MEAITENAVGFALLGVVLALGVVLLVVPLVRERIDLARALRDPTWSSLTGGELTRSHRGEVWSFWASGSVRREGPHGARPTNRVVIDEVALAFVMLSGRRGRTRRSWLRREDVPLLVVRPVWHGCRVSDPISGFHVRVRALGVDAVAERLRGLGWQVEAGSDRPARPGARPTERPS